MIKAKIRFSTLQDINDFVSKVSKYDAYVDIKRNNILLDGKSLEGLCALQLGLELDCIVHSSLKESSALIDDVKCYTITNFIEV